MTILKPQQSIIHNFVRWALYPLSWMFVLAMLALAWHSYLEPRQAWGISTLILIIVYASLELIVPYQKRWGITWRSFLTDIQYIFLNGAFTSLISVGLAYFTITISGNLSGLATSWPLWLQAITIFFTFEICHYPLHRFMHEGRGRLGGFMWKVHVAHHLPDKLYVLMHVVGHPLNALFIQTIVIVFPIWLMGYDPLIVAGFLTINGMHGILSHFNVDLRMGWMNYIFVGPELHRYHHSSDMRLAKNFGANLSIFDQVFGTFIYKASIPPKNLGAENTEQYPSYHNLIKILIMPFKM